MTCSPHSTLPEVEKPSGGATPISQHAMRASQTKSLKPGRKRGKKAEAGKRSKAKKSSSSKSSTKTKKHAAKKKTASI